MFAAPDEEPRVGVRVGDYVVDLAPVAAASYDVHVGLFEQPTLNVFMATGAEEWARVRSWLQDLLVDPAAEAMVGPHLVPVSEVELRLPFEVADYVDFYASLDHASNVGKIFRPDDAALPAAWRHLPIGYHGRAGTVVVSGTDVRRPSGQRRGADGPTFGPSQRLDIEAELGFVVGTGSALGLAGADVRRSPRTCSASSASTTGRPATSRPGSTSPSGPSSASRSPPRCRPG